MVASGPEEGNETTDAAAAWLDPEAQTRRQLFLAGSLSALSLFCNDEASRSVLLRLTTTTNPSTSSSGGDSDVSARMPSLVDGLLEYLEEYNQRSGNGEDDFAAVVCLRFLAHWMTGAPFVVQSIFSSHHSIILSTLFSSKNFKIAALTSLLLGLAMNEMVGEVNDHCGGWTRAGLMELVCHQRRGGVSRFTAQLQSLHQTTDLLPWSVCELEWAVWSNWYKESVLVVRKRVVQELTHAAAAEGEDRKGLEHEGDSAAVTSRLSPNATAGGASVTALREEASVQASDHRALQNLVAQQTTEIEGLQKALADAQAKVASQGRFCDMRL